MLIVRNKLNDAVVTVWWSDQLCAWLHLLRGFFTAMMIMRVRLARTPRQPRQVRRMAETLCSWATEFAVLITRREGARTQVFPVFRHGGGGLNRRIWGEICKIYINTGHPTFKNGWKLFFKQFINIFGVNFGKSWKFFMVKILQSWSGEMMTHLVTHNLSPPYWLAHIPPDCPFRCERWEMIRDDLV